MPGVDANVSADGQAILINIAGLHPASDLDFTAEFMPRIRAAVRRSRAFPRTTRAPPPGNPRST